MRNRFYVLSAAMLFIFGLAGCSVNTVGSKDVQPSAIHQAYTASYSEDLASTEFFATFRVGGSTGTTVRLESPSVLRVDNDEIAAHNFFGTHYSNKMSPGLRRVIGVRWTDQTGANYHNTIVIRPFLLRIDQLQIRSNQSYQVAFSAPEYDADDSFGATLTQSLAQGPSTVINGRALAGASGLIQFDVRDLANLRPGFATLSVYRTTNHRLTQATREGGYATGTYRARAVQITVY